MQKDRIASIDMVRGLALCGILVMNIQSFGLPTTAYINPLMGGGADTANMALWLVQVVAFDGKMRALFAMLFGASILLLAERDDDGAAVRHAARMGVLLLIGMLHAWFVWHGDILVPYAVVGLMIFPLRGLPARRLLELGALALLMQALFYLSAAWDAHGLQQAAARPGADAMARAAWEAMLQTTTSPSSVLQQDIARFGGSLSDVHAARTRLTWMSQTLILPSMVFLETAGFMLFGMGLLKLGWWQGDRPARHYRRMVLLAVPAGWAVTAIMAEQFRASDFGPVWSYLSDTVRTLVAPLVAIGYSAAVIGWAKSGRWKRLAHRLAGAGRMALTNYLMTSILMTTLFYGYGLGLFGRLERVELLVPVVGMWALMLGWSAPWLIHFRQGPFEWLWRSLASGRPQSFRRMTG